MAQTTCLASFGPVYIVTTFHLPHIAYYNLNKLINSYKTWKKKKKHLLMAQTDTFHIVRARSRRSHPPRRVFVTNNLYKQYKRWLVFKKIKKKKTKK